MIDIRVAVSPEDLLDGLVMLRDEDALFELITDIDAMMVDWDFTERLYNHFKLLHKEYKEEKKMLKELYK